MRRIFFALFFIVMFLPSVSTGLADRGMVPVEPGVSIYEPGQKAIIAWNGQEEILILSTDVSAADDTMVLEMMPLPSNPKKIEKASFESFVTIQTLLGINARTVLGGNYAPDSTRSVEVTFHEKIGAHDITVVKANDASELTTWAEAFLESNNITQGISLEKFKSVIEDYMARGFRFYVLDIIQMSNDQKSVEPILYQFETSFLYYPLKISSPISGNTKITLFLLTNGKIESDLFFSPTTVIRQAYYRSPGQWKPIQLNLTKGQLSIIDLRIGEMFPNGAWLTAMEYEGPMSWLTSDFMISEASITEETGDDSGQADSINSQEINRTFFLVGIAAGAACTLAGALLTFGVTRKEKNIKVLASSSNDRSILKWSASTGTG